MNKQKLLELIRNTPDNLVEVIIKNQFNPNIIGYTVLIHSDPIEDDGFEIFYRRDWSSPRLGRGALIQKTDLYKDRYHPDLQDGRFGGWNQWCGPAYPVEIPK